MSTKFQQPTRHANIPITRLYWQFWRLALQLISSFVSRVMRVTGCAFACGPRGLGARSRMT
jgi:hypothetical protein